MEKLFVVVRNDLDPGLQLAQGIHAAVKYVLEHEDARRWHEESNNVAVLQVPSEMALEILIGRAQQTGKRVSAFQEPDLGGQYTAAAFSHASKSQLGSLPLALKSS